MDFAVQFVFCFLLRDNYSLLVEELKAAFESKGWLLTAAVPAPQFRVDDGYDVRRSIYTLILLS